MAADYDTLVYTEVGGSKMIVADGGELEVQSGGTLDILSGANFNVGTFGASMVVTQDDNYPVGIFGNIATAQTTGSTTQRAVWARMDVDANLSGTSSVMGAELQFRYDGATSIGSGTEAEQYTGAWLYFEQDTSGDTLADYCHASASFASVETHSDLSLSANTHLSGIEIASRLGAADGVAWADTTGTTAALFITKAPAAAGVTASNWPYGIFIENVTTDIRLQQGATILNEAPHATQHHGGAMVLSETISTGSAGFYYGITVLPTITADQTGQIGGASIWTSVTGSGTTVSVLNGMELVVSASNTSGGGGTGSTYFRGLYVATAIGSNTWTEMYGFDLYNASTTAWTSGIRLSGPTTIGIDLDLCTSMTTDIKLGQGATILNEAPGAHHHGGAIVLSETISSANAGAFYYGLTVLPTITADQNGQFGGASIWTDVTGSGTTVAVLNGMELVVNAGNTSGGGGTGSTTFRGLYVATVMGTNTWTEMYGFDLYNASTTSWTTAMRVTGPAVTGISLESAMTDGLIISGTCSGDGIRISGACTDNGIEITGTCTDSCIQFATGTSAHGLYINQACTVDGINIAADCQIGTTIAAQTTSAINIATGQVTGINIAGTCSTAGISMGALSTGGQALLITWTGVGDEATAAAAGICSLTLTSNANAGSDNDLLIGYHVSITAGTDDQANNILVGTDSIITVGKNIDSCAGGRFTVVLNDASGEVDDGAAAVYAVATATATSTITAGPFTAVWAQYNGAAAITTSAGDTSCFFGDIDESIDVGLSLDVASAKICAIGIALVGAGTYTAGIDVAAATTGIDIGNCPTGIDFTDVGATTEHLIHVVDAYTGMVIETGTYGSGNTGVTLVAANPRPASFLFDDGGSALASENYRALTSRIRLNASPASVNTAIRAIQGMLSVGSAIDLDMGAGHWSVTGGVQGYVQFAGGVHTIGAHTRVAAVHATLEAYTAMTVTAGGMLCGVLAQNAMDHGTVSVTSPWPAAFCADRLDALNVATQEPWNIGLYIPDDGCTTGIRIGDCAADAIYIEGDITDNGIEISGTCTDSCIQMLTGTSAYGINMSQAFTTAAINVAANTVIDQFLTIGTSSDPIHWDGVLENWLVHTECTTQGNASKTAHKFVLDASHTGATTSGRLECLRAETKSYSTENVSAGMRALVGQVTFSGDCTYVGDGMQGCIPLVGAVWSNDDVVATGDVFAAALMMQLNGSSSAFNGESAFIYCYNAGVVAPESLIKHFPGVGGGASQMTYLIDCGGDTLLSNHQYFSADTIDTASDTESDGTIKVRLGTTVYEIPVYLA